MILKVLNDHAAYNVLSCLLAAGSDLGEVVVATAVWSRTRRLAERVQDRFRGSDSRCDVDRVTTRIGGVTLTFVPVGDGGKIRGENVLLVVEDMPAGVQRRAGVAKCCVHYSVGRPGEVFLPADTPEEAARVEALNDREAASVKAERLDHLRKEGTVAEEDMPDSRRAVARHEALVKGLDVVMDNLEVRLSRGWEGHVKLDGRELRGLQKLTVEAEVGKLPKVTMELHPVPTAAAAGG